MAKQAMNYRDEYRRIRKNYLQYIRRHSFRGYVIPSAIPTKIGKAQVAKIEREYEKLKAEGKTGKVQKKVEKARKQAVQRIFHVDISKIPAEERHPIFLKPPKEMEEWQAEFIPKVFRPTPTLIAEIEEKIKDWTDYRGELMVDDDLKRDIQSGFLSTIEAIEAQEERDRDEQQRAQEEYDAFRRQLEREREREIEDDEDEEQESLWYEPDDEDWAQIVELQAKINRQREEERNKIYESIPEINPYEDIFDREKIQEEYPWQGSVILDNLREEIDKWVPDPLWTDYFAEAKRMDRNRARNDLEGAVAILGEETVARNCEGNAQRLHDLLDFILYGSEGRAKASIDGALIEFNAIIRAKIPTPDEARAISEFEAFEYDEEK